ncbi:hypothetical protein CI610_03034 [invertebrate metagenome]|uniref:Uncharacterized protein n=1 Tax=invertebrate metagenome TaxID=1711999 RepID=A0A2H9T4A3_9ZZZZ
MKLFTIVGLFCLMTEIFFIQESRSVHESVPQVFQKPLDLGIKSQASMTFDMETLIQGETKRLKSKVYKTGTEDLVDHLAISSGWRVINKFTVPHMSKLPGLDVVENKGKGVFDTLLVCLMPIKCFNYLVKIFLLFR